MNAQFIMHDTAICLNVTSLHLKDYIVTYTLIYTVDECRPYLVNNLTLGFMLNYPS